MAPRIWRHGSRSRRAALELARLEHAKGCHSFAGRDRGERRRANEDALLRCRKHLNVLAVNIDGTRQGLALFDPITELRQSEKKTAAFGADAQEIPHHVICFGWDACSVDHAKSNQTIANAAHAFRDYLRLKTTSFADLK